MTSSNFFKKCPCCKCSYFILELPEPLKKPEGCDDGFDYFTCDHCHSTFLVAMELIAKCEAKLRR